MAITNNLIVVIQNEPRDGDIVYLEKDEEAFKRRVVELDMVEADVADEIVETGQMYYDDDNACTIIGYEVRLPYYTISVCGECFWEGEQEAQHEVGSHLFVNFVAEADCESCNDKEE